MSQGPLCPNLSQKVQAEVSQMANHNLSRVILLGGLSVNLNHLKTWWTGAPGKPCGLLFIYAALTWKRVWRPWALDGGSGAIKPVLWPYVRQYHAQNVIFFFHLHIQSVGRDTKLHSGVSLNYECGHWVWPCSGSSGHWVLSENYLTNVIIEQIASRRRHVHLNAARF